MMWESAHLTNRCFGVDGSQSRASQRLPGPSSVTNTTYSTTESSTQTINTTELFYTAIFLVDYLFTASCCTLSSPSSLSVSDLVETFQVDLAHDRQLLMSLKWLHNVFNI